jgi:hypothetical protein
MSAFAAIGLVAILTFLVQTAIRVEKIKSEERAALLQNFKHP